MIWLITIPVALVMAYAVLNLMIGIDVKGSSSAPYWVMLAVSAAVLYVAWFHPVRIAFI